MPDLASPPADAGLPTGRPSAPAAPPAPRRGDDLIQAAAEGGPLLVSEAEDLLAYFLTNAGLPGDDEPVPVEWEAGNGRGTRKNVWHIRPLAWEEWQDARQRAIDPATGRFDGFVVASYTVARTLVRPQLGPTVKDLQARDPKSAPGDAAELLRRMFARQSGVLIDLHAKVLEISKLDDADPRARILDREVEAAKG